MRDDLRIDEIEVSTIPHAYQRDGLMGFVRLTVNDALRLDGIAIRRTAEGRIVLSYPKRGDAYGIDHFPVRPVDDETRRFIEQEVFRALGIEELASRR